MKIVILGRRPGRPHRRAAPLARGGQRSHGGRHQRGHPARAAGPARHPHRGRQRRVPDGAGGGRRRRGRDHRRAHLQRRGQHDRLRGGVHAVPHAHQDRAHPRRGIHQPPGSCSARRPAGGRLHQPGAARHRVRRAADPLSRRPAGARIRRRQACAWSGCARTGRAAGRPAACASCAQHVPKIEARVVAIYRAGRAISTRGRHGASRRATRCSSSPRATTSAAS